ncbi:MAG: hypothetical protein COZ07_10430, partial [Candidatus Infernicultor aquiphilus]
MTKTENDQNINHGESQAEVSHEATLYAEPIFRVGNFSVTNSLLNSWVAVFILVVFFILVGKKVAKIPKGAQNIFEII